MLSSSQCHDDSQSYLHRIYVYRYFLFCLNLKKLTLLMSFQVSESSCIRQIQFGRIFNFCSSCFDILLLILMRSFRSGLTIFWTSTTISTNVSKFPNKLFNCVKKLYILKIKQFRFYLNFSGFYYCQSARMCVCQILESGYITVKSKQIT